MTFHIPILLLPFICLHFILTAQPAAGNIPPKPTTSLATRNSPSSPLQPETEPICQVYLYSRYHKGDDEAESPDELFQALVMDVELDQRWAPLCGPSLRLALAAACPRLRIDFDREGLSLLDDGRCNLRFRVLPGDGWHFEPLLVRWDLDLSRAGCLFWGFNCVAREKGLLPLKGCVSASCALLGCCETDDWKQMVKKWPWKGWADWFED